VSLLWKDAADYQRTAAWWNEQHDFEHERGDEHYPPLRTDKLKARRNRYVSQIVDRHNVPRKAAFEAMQHVAGHLDSDYATIHPSDYGFASAPRRNRDHYSPEMTKRLQDPETWRHRPVEQVPTDEIHATQDFIRPSSVAHNLFWPGHRQPVSDDETGDPDVEPEPEEHDITDDYEYHSSDRSPQESADQRELHRHAKFVERHDGRIELADGHHRVAADMLLGKTTTPGHLIHERELMRPPGQQPHAWPMNRDSMQAHLVEDHGWSPGDVDENHENFRAMDRTHDYEHNTWQHKLEHDHE
jgi:hypothetical protein